RGRDRARGVDSATRRRRAAQRPLRPRRLNLLTGLLTALVAAVLALAGGTQAAGTTPPSPQKPWIAVHGKRLVTRGGRPVRLLGVNRSGTEYACVQGTGFFQGPSDAASIAAIKGWDANAVRVPLNESCWLGGPGVPAEYSGAAYRQTIEGWVERL